jgi:hypothetical protein
MTHRPPLGQRCGNPFVAVAAYRLSCWQRALMGTAAAECRQERAGDGVSPEAGAADQITPEPPEEQP